MNVNSLQCEFVRYIGAGGVAFIADFTVLSLLTSSLGLHYLVATLFAFLFGTWVNSYYRYIGCLVIGCFLNSV